ncbi:hypothetical protein RRG08_038334 [Elysia crispata]|uniref:Uncharacterized protein n=1 Tax=Elysia crispata TaxID=231223 RepID=A0AAE1E1H9_9GAST|nr:hypothetical protein RRG08_038334 [Elysia crispata]
MVRSLLSINGDIGSNPREKAAGDLRAMCLPLHHPALTTSLVQEQIYRNPEPTRTAAEDLRAMCLPLHHPALTTPLVQEQIYRNPEPTRTGS